MMGPTGIKRAGFAKISGYCAVSLIAVAASGAHGQEAPVAEEIAPQDEIVVEGIRAALESAENRKRQSAVVVDGISADDIGLLPDVSISESLTRISGVTANDTARGADQVAIRGLGPDLASTEYNGRILPTADGVNRRVGLGGLPSEGLSGAFVQKTPDAATIEGGVSGILQLESIRPLESKKKGLTVVIRGLYEEGADEYSKAKEVKPFGLRGEVTYVGNVTDNLAVALTYAGIKDYNTQSGVQLESWRFDSSTRQVAAAAPPARPLATTQVGARYDVNGDGRPDALPTNAGPIAQFFNTERHSVLGMVQWQPTGWLTVSADGVFSEETNSNHTRRLFALNLFDGANGALTSSTVVNDTVVAFNGQVSNYRGVINDNTIKDHTYGGGLNFAIDDGGPLTAKFDFAYFEAGRDRFTPVVNFDNDANTTLVAVQQAASQRLPFAYDITDRGNASFTFAPLTADDFAIQQINTTKQDSTDEIQSARADFKYNFDEGALRALRWGGRYDTRFHGQRVDNTIYTYGTRAVPPALLPGETALANRPDLTAAMLQLAGNPFAGDAMAFGGASAVAFPYYDFATLFRLGTTAPFTVVNDQIIQDAGANNDIEEDSFSLYGQADLDFGNVTGNIGLRFVTTASEARGTSVSTRTVAGVTTISFDPVAVSNSYSYFLPSANFKWSLTNDLLVRFGAARTMSRPLFEQLRVGVGVDLTNAATTTPAITIGNPNLKPFTADGVDLGIEWYPNRGTSIAIAGYYKWVTNFTTQATTAEPFDFPDGTVGSANVTRFFNDPAKRYFRGFEVQMRKDFDFLPGLLSKFGVQANYNYNETDARETFTSLAGPASFTINTTGTAAGVVTIPVATSVAVLPINLSKHVLNAVLYYDTPQLNFRLAYRYYDEYSRRFANGYQYQPEGQLDFNFGVKLLDGVRLIGTVTNILNASQYRLTEDSRNAGNNSLLQFYGTRGRDYALGLRVQF